LAIWIIVAAGIGIGIGQIPHIVEGLDELKVGSTNMLSAIAMVAMLVGPFAAVRWNELWGSLRSVPLHLTIGSLAVNWVIGPLLMFGLGLATLNQEPELLEGVLYIGAARCIAMVLVWNALAEGDGMLCVSLVLLNSIVTMALYAPWLVLLGYITSAIGIAVPGSVSFTTVLLNVAIYLGIPVALGIAIWAVTFCGFGEACHSRVIGRIAPLGLYALLAMVVLMFCEMTPQLFSGDSASVSVLLVLAPLLLYFVLMFSTAWAIARWLLGAGHAQTVTFAFTATGNNFELALAACSAIFGSSSQQALATVMGPFIEIPVMLLLVEVAKWLGRRAARPCASAGK